MPSPLGFIIPHCLVFVLFPVTFWFLSSSFLRLSGHVLPKVSILLITKSTVFEKHALTSQIGSATSLCNA
jgi:hypothetical protein